MQERQEPDMNRVRDAMRDHDEREQLADEEADEQSSDDEPDEDDS